MKNFTAKFVFVQTEHPEQLISWLEAQGYGGIYMYDLDIAEYDCIFIVNGSYFPCLYEDQQKELSKPIWTDCGDNSYIFKQLALMQDDTEVHQWFLHKDGLSCWEVDEDNKTFENDFNLCNTDPEHKIEDYHRATQEELYDYLVRIKRATLSL